MVLLSTHSLLIYSSSLLILINLPLPFENASHFFGQFIGPRLGCGWVVVGPVLFQCFAPPLLLMLPQGTLFPQGASLVAPTTIFRALQLLQFLAIRVQQRVLSQFASPGTLRHSDTLETKLFQLRRKRGVFKHPFWRLEDNQLLVVEVKPLQPAEQEIHDVVDVMGLFSYAVVPIGLIPLMYPLRLDGVGEAGGR